VKEALGEEVCKEILIDKTPEEIVNKIRQIIDPFYLKVDEDSLNRVCADKQEEGDPIPMGFCGDYCPVALKNGWLIKGKEEFEAGIQGRRFKFCGEKELNEFKTDPGKFLLKGNPSVAPRIMFMGVRGVGLKTQLLKLN
jgi:adenylate/nucleoside-diphosphate kinase